MRCISLVLGSVALIFGIAGCSDNPENEAAKEIRQGVDDAVDVVVSRGDYATASEQLGGVINQHARNAGDYAVPGLLAAGNIGLGQAEMMKANLRSVNDQVSKQIENLSKSVREVAHLEVQKNALENLVQSSQQQIEKFKETLNGTVGGKSVEARLAEVNVKIAQLESEIEELDQKLGAAKQKENAIQQQADEKFRQAERASGRESTDLEQAGYDLLLSKNTYYVEIQDLTDQIDRLQSKVELLTPLQQQLVKSKQELTERMGNLQAAPANSNIEGQIEELAEMYQAKLQTLSQQAGDLLDKLNTYAAQVNGVAALFEASYEEYFQRVRKGDLARDAAAAGTAQCQFGIGRLYSEGQRFLLDSGERVASVSGAANGAASGELAVVVEFCSKTSQDWQEMAMVNLDQAIEEFGELAEQVRDDQARCAALKCKLLAVYSKRQLADEMGSLDVYDNAVSASDELMATIGECDQDFAASSLSRLITEGVYFVPTLATEEIIVQEVPEERPTPEEAGEPAEPADPNALW